jgi:cationic amino acid transporter 14
MFVMKMVGLLYLLILIFDLIVVCGMGSMSGATTFFLVVFLLAIIAVLLVISRKPQNRWVGGGGCGVALCFPLQFHDTC